MTDLVKSSTVLVNGAQYTPERVATDLMDTVKDIEKAIKGSESAIEEVNGRGILKSVFSSSSKDLVTISRSQHKINELMLSLIQEIITLNVMSYSYLSAVLAEFQKSIKEGWIDSEGRFQILSENGEAFANTASEIFEKIIEGSRSTQEKIDLNSTRIEGLRQFLEQKNALDEQQSRDIASLKSALHDKSNIVDQQSRQIESLADSLKNKKSLIGEQSRQLEEMRRLLDEQSLVDGQLAKKLVELVEELQRKEEKGISRDGAITVLNDVVEELKLRTDRLGGRCKALGVAVTVLGLGATVLAVTLGLVVFDML